MTPAGEIGHRPDHAPPAASAAALLRGSDLHLVVLLGAVAGVVVLSLDPAGATVLRGLVWAAAGVGMVVRAPVRSEPTGAIRLLGVADLAIAVVWWLVATGPAPDAPDIVQLAPLAIGLTGIGVATLVATPSWRHRASLLDGVILALSGAVLVLVVLGGEALGADTALVVEVVAFATLLGPAVMAASVQSRVLRPAAGSVPAAIGMLALVHAGVTTAAAAVAARPLSMATEVSWVVAPVAGLVMAWRAAPSYHRLDGVSARRPSTRRLVGLVAVAVAPVPVTLVLAPERLVAALATALAASIVVALRVAVSARFDVAEAEAAADVRFDALVEHAAEVLALLDGEDRLFYISQAVQETFHVPPAEVLGLSPTELAHPEDVEEVETILGRVREQPGVPVHARLRLLDGHGASRHVEATVVDLRHVPGVGAISLTVRDVTERVTLEAELVRQARTDGLTGLVTRTVLIERVDHVLTARQPAAALLFIDLDDFKLVNDAYGHAAGDTVLTTLASRLQGVVRSHDTAGRVGGDEFAVLLQELEDPVQDALRIAERIVDTTRQPIEVDGEPLEVRASVGVALPAAGMTTAELFAAADAAMYEAKRDKRGVLLYEPGMRASSRSRLQLMRDVRAAIEEGALAVTYQPIVDAVTGELHGAEALLRWVHPELGNITPDIILDHADAAGLTEELTNRIVGIVGRGLRRWREAMDAPLSLAINLSAEQLVHVEPEELLLQLVGGPRARGAITIEITETSMLGDLAAAARVLDVFRDAGCHVAVDDFGTGYASIGYLRRLPLDKLKIDREFIAGIAPDTVEGSFAAVIQNLAAALDLTTIAEGVETAEQLEAVRLLGCDLVQGYLVSDGLSMDELIEWSRSDVPTVFVDAPAERQREPAVGVTDRA